MLIDITTYYLEMTDPAELRPSASKRGEVEAWQAKVPSPELNRFLYSAVGGDWYWTDRLSWSYERWREYLSQPGLETWVVYASGTPAGYFELAREPATDVKIQYFGLLPQFIGTGIGGFALTAAIQRGWGLGAKRVWVHTCTLDHPQALSNYLARGFRIYDQKSKRTEIPDQTPGPWPGAR